MTHTDKKYEAYRLGWMRDNEVFLNRSLRNAVAVAIRLNQAITVLSSMGIEPGDTERPAPSNLGAALWHMDTCIQEIILGILSPILAGADPDMAKDAVDRAVCAVADARLKIDDNGTDDVLMAAFADTLSSILEDNMPGIRELSGQIVDFMEDGIRKTRGLDDQADAVLSGGAYDAVRDAATAEIRRHVNNDAPVNPSKLADAVLHAIWEACRNYGIPTADLPHPSDAGDYLRETFSNWASHMAGWKTGTTDGRDPDEDAGTESTDVPTKWPGAGA